MRTNVLRISMKKEVKVLLFGKTSQAKKEIEALFHEVQINLENNYKDLAHKALKELDELVTKLNEEGQLKEKDYTKLRDKVDDYKRRMAGYHH